MHPREFVFLAIGIGIGGLIHRHREGNVLEKAERTKGISKESVVRFTSILALFYAVLFGAVALIALFGAVGMVLGLARWEPFLFLLLPCLAMLSASCAWLGLRLGEEWSLLDRSVRAVYAAIAAFRSDPSMVNQPGLSKAVPHDLA